MTGGREGSRKAGVTEGFGSQTKKSELCLVSDGTHCGVMI